jgi:hypothetical protein
MRTRQTGQMRPELIGRRTFSIAALVLLGATIAIGCGGAPNNQTSPTTTTTTTTTSTEGQNIGVVSDNHPIPHVAIISAAQLSAGAGISLDISNGSHSHTVILTGDQVMEIAAKGRVSVDSSTNPPLERGRSPRAHSDF